MIPYEYSQLNYFIFNFYHIEKVNPYWYYQNLVSMSICVIFYALVIKTIKMMESERKMNNQNTDLLIKYFKTMNKFSMESHKNQLIQECSELIQNLSKQRQRVLNGEEIEQEILDNFPEELIHVRLIIDYLLFNDADLIFKCDNEFLKLCKKYGVIEND